MDMINRPRRLRQNPAILSLCRETRVSADSLIYPIFVDESLTGVRAIPSLEGQYHYGLDALPLVVDECQKVGVTKCILFGIPRKKDATGSSAWDKDGVIQQTVQIIKKTIQIFL